MAGGRQLRSNLASARARERERERERESGRGWPHGRRWSESLLTILVLLLDYENSPLHRGQGRKQRSVVPSSSLSSGKADTAAHTRVSCWPPYTCSNCFSYSLEGFCRCGSWPTKATRFSRGGPASREGLAETLGDRTAEIASMLPCSWMTLRHTDKRYVAARSKVRDWTRRLCPVSLAIPLVTSPAS